MANTGVIHGHAAKIIVDEANGVVVAELTGCAWDVINELSARGLSFGNMRRKRDYARMLLPEKMRVVWRGGAALADAEQAAQGEAFDAHTGAPIALAWLERKYWRKYAGRVGLVASYLRETADELDRLQDKWAAHAERIDPLRTNEAQDAPLAGAGQPTQEGAPTGATRDEDSGEAAPQSRSCDAPIVGAGQPTEEEAPTGATRDEDSGEAAPQSRSCDAPLVGAGQPTKEEE